MEADGIVDVLENPVFDLISAVAEDFSEFDGGAVFEALFIFVGTESARDEFDVVLEFFEEVFRCLG